ncbi:MAG TPA: hypothetical protein VN811_10820 [Thermoanaerobaculia bacterium]|nr:hypothetical protein [Thermoanaerobaculia bacterium]HXT51526.1 hypothetical protein [Thermoanaerobaculia bacterium]
MSGDRLHELADARSLALHRAVAERLHEQPELLDAARERVESWRRDGTVAPYYVAAWTELLAGARDEVVAAIVAPGERATALRHVTPFAGVVDPRTRWRIWRQERAAFAGR